jgi:hypothetical protein
MNSIEPVNIEEESYETQPAKTMAEVDKIDQASAKKKPDNKTIQESRFKKHSKKTNEKTKLISSEPTNTKIGLRENNESGKIEKPLLIKQACKNPVKRGDEGYSYEIVKGIDLFMWLSSDKRKFYDFKFGTQLKDTGKFDDAIIGYQPKQGDRFKYSLFQMKHRSTTCPKETLTVKHFVHSHSSEKCSEKAFCLREYFHSFQLFKPNKKNGEFQDGDFENFFIVTNRSVNLDSFKNSTIELSLVQIEFLKGKCFKIGKSCIESLIQALDIPKKHIGQFSKFLEKFVLSFEEPSDPEIKSELKKLLGDELQKVFHEFFEFSLESCPEKWFQKQKLFEQKNVTFQGQQELTSISALLPECNNLYSKLDQKTILNLITKQLEIGKSKNQNEFMQAIENVLENLFIDQTFQVKNVISDPEKINDDENGFQLLSEFESLNTQTTVPKNCHYLTKVNGQIIWIKSEGSIKKIQNIPTGESAYSEAEIISRAVKVNIIAGEPGKGKSVFLSHLEKTLQQITKNAWVIRINLTDLLNCFMCSSLNYFNREEECMEFLTDNCLEFENNFEKSLFKMKLPDVILLLDGLDEITKTNYKDMCVKWIQGLAQTKISHIWISTRAHLQTEMEEAFGCLANTIKSFSKEDQVRFLVKFWGKEFHIDDCNQTKNVAIQLIEHLSKAISAHENLDPFIGNPLILFMVAEIYKEQTISFFENIDNISFQDPLTLIGIYKKFCDLKLVRYFSDFVSRALPEFEQILEMFTEEHELLSVWHLFGAEFENVITKEQRIKLRELIKKIESGHERRGIIYGIQNKVIVFMHQSFAEYLAASWFVKQLLPNKDLNNKTDLDVKEKKLKDLLEKHCFNHNIGLIIHEG